MIEIINKTKINEVLGDVLNSRFIYELDLFQREHFIFSIADFYGMVGKKKKLTREGIHSYVNHKGPIMLDSGGFQLISKNKPFKIDETIEIYKLASLQQDDCGIVLDLMPQPNDTPTERMEKIKITNDNYLKMKSLAPELANKIINVIHGWTVKEQRFSMSILQDEKLIAIGSHFFLLLKGYRTQVIQKFISILKLINANSQFQDTRFHVLGASGANSSHICWFAGLEQTDSASWRIKAAFGKIVFVGVSEISIAGKESFGHKSWNETYDDMLRQCKCPICRGLNLDEKKLRLGFSFEARAIHNACIYLQERDLAKELIGTPRYLRYLKKRFKRSYIMRNFLEKIKEAKFQPNIDQYFNLKNSKNILKI